jgi:hypothetical protein
VYLETTRLVGTAAAAGGAVARPVLRRVESAGLATLDAVLASRLAEEAVDRVLASPLARHSLERALESALVEVLLRSDALWLVVDEVARSPAVTEAVTQQSAGFADQVADGMRARSRNADAWLERKARRALRRSGR